MHLLISSPLLLWISMHEFIHLMFDFRHVPCVIVVNWNRPPSSPWLLMHVNVHTRIALSTRGEIIHLLKFGCLSVRRPNSPARSLHQTYYSAREKNHKHGFCEGVWFDARRRISLRKFLFVMAQRLCIHKFIIVLVFTSKICTRLFTRLKLLLYVFVYVRLQGISILIMRSNLWKSFSLAVERGRRERERWCGKGWAGEISASIGLN